MPFKKGQSGNPRGRKEGVQNKATTDARAAIALFVEGNVERLNGWLDAIAEGEKKTKVIQKDGKEITEETEEWARRPDPQGAFSAFMSVIEYNVPKLARTEIQPLDENGEKTRAEYNINIHGVAPVKEKT